MKKEKNKTQVMEIHEVGIVYKRPLFTSMIHIKCSHDINNFLRTVIDMDVIDLKEFFWVILLNNSNRVLGISEIGRGDTNGVVVNVKEIFQLVVKTNCSSIAICHNHPSGNLTSSQKDREITSKVKNACALLSVSLIDHIIISSEHYFSFADDGIL